MNFSSPKEGPLIPNKFAIKNTPREITVEGIWDLV